MHFAMTVRSIPDPPTFRWGGYGNVKTIWPNGRQPQLSEQQREQLQQHRQRFKTMAIKEMNRDQ